MRRFFTQSINIGENYIITGEDAHHIKKSLRMEIGEKLILSSPDGYDYLGKITGFVGGVELETLSKEENRSEVKTKIHLYQCIPKGSKFDFITQKAVELGVREITPVISRYTISRPNNKSGMKKVERWQKIAEEAAKQSQRGIIPKVNNQDDYTNCIIDACKKSEVIVFYEKAPLENKINTYNFKEGKDYSIFIGSEGGFSEEEIGRATKEGGNILSLGRRILRTETAPIVAMSAILFSLDEF